MAASSSDALSAFTGRNQTLGNLEDLAVPIAETPKDKEGKKADAKRADGPDAHAKAAKAEVKDNAAAASGDEGDEAQEADLEKQKKEGARLDRDRMINKSMKNHEEWCEMATTKCQKALADLASAQKAAALVKDKVAGDLRIALSRQRALLLVCSLDPEHPKQQVAEEAAQDALKQYVAELAARENQASSPQEKKPKAAKEGTPASASDSVIGERLALLGSAPPVQQLPAVEDLGLDADGVRVILGVVFQTVG